VLPPKADRNRTPSLLSLPGRAASRLREHRSAVEPGSFDLVYANSAASAGLAGRLAAEAACPAICHVHELGIAMSRFAARFRDASRHIDCYIAVSRAVERNLVDSYGIDIRKIVRIHEAIPVGSTVVAPEARSALRDELDIPPGAFVVGGCGTADWRKAPDVFLLVAKAVARREPSRPFHFLWVGGEPNQLEMVHHDLERLGLTSIVHFIGARPDPARYFGLFDAFLLTSREDPFPLVCLEAAALGVPIVCFADAGGMPEFVEDDAGYVVPYLAVDDAADRLVCLAESEPTRTALGHRAAAKVAERCSIDVIGPQIAAVLDRYLG
jgi:glycosyltransferase involved in cell wall biosynthesis